VLILCCVENCRSETSTEEPSPPTAAVARCDLLAQLGALLTNGGGDPQSTAASGSFGSVVRSVSSPSGMPRPDNDTVPSVDTSPGGTVPNDDSVDTEAATSGIICFEATILSIQKAV